MADESIYAQQSAGAEPQGPPPSDDLGMVAPGGDAASYGGTGKEVKVTVCGQPLKVVGLAVGCVVRLQQQLGLAEICWPARSHSP